MIWHVVAAAAAAAVASVVCLALCSDVIGRRPPCAVWAAAPAVAGTVPWAVWAAGLSSGAVLLSAAPALAAVPVAWSDVTERRVPWPATSPMWFAWALTAGACAAAWRLSGRESGELAWSAAGGVLAGGSCTAVLWVLWAAGRVGWGDVKLAPVAAFAGWAAVEQSGSAWAGAGAGVMVFWWSAVVMASWRLIRPADEYAPLGAGMAPMALAAGLIPWWDAVGLVA